MHFIKLYQRHMYNDRSFQKHRNEVLFSSFGKFVYPKDESDMNRISLYSITMNFGFYSIWEIPTGTVVYRMGTK